MTAAAVCLPGNGAGLVQISWQQPCASTPKVLSSVCVTAAVGWASDYSVLHMCLSTVIWMMLATVAEAHTCWHVAVYMHNVCWEGEQIE